MKLRILSNSIRLRLSQTEVGIIASGESVTCATHFDESTFIYSLKLVEKEGIRASLSAFNITIEVNKKEGLEWAKGEDVGIRSNPGENPEILIEKDFKCLTERGEDETDLFENPNTKC